MCNHSHKNISVICDYAHSGPQLNLYTMQAGELLSLSIEELLAFIGLNVAMGMVHLLRAHDYWSTKPMFRIPWFSTVMSHDRFFKISKYLHLAKSSRQKKRWETVYDPLYKICPLIEKVKTPLMSITDKAVNWQLMK